jgi:hypothetical protein
MMGTTTATVATSHGTRVALELRLARRGAASSAECQAGCLLLDTFAIDRQRELDRIAARELEQLEETRRLAAAIGSYAAQRIAA